jgi:hypothetical protein
MIIKILTKQDFLDLLCSEWKFTTEGKEALYKHLNNAESNFIFNRAQILSEWEEHESIEIAKNVNQFIAVIGITKPAIKRVVWVVWWY